MISRKHSISSVINHATLYFSAFLLILLLVLTYYYVEISNQRDQTVFHSHVQQLANEITELKSSLDAKAQFLASDQQLIKAVYARNIQALQNWTRLARQFSPEIVGIGVFDPQRKLIGDAESQNMTKQCLQQASLSKTDLAENEITPVHLEIENLAHWDTLIPIGDSGYQLLVSYSAALLSQQLKATGNLGNYYELTNAEQRVISRFGKNHGDSQYQVSIDKTDWALMTRKQSSSVLARTPMPFYVLALSFILINSVLFFLGRQVVGFFRADFRQMVKAVDLTANQKTTTSVTATIFLKEFSDLHQSLLQMISEGRKAKEFIHNEGFHDPFTSLLNKRRFLECQQKFYNMASRQIGIMLVVMDIDNLTEINKRFGQDQGDIIIKGISDILRAAVRNSDESFYLGNGRFALAMVETEATEILKWYEFISRRFDVLEQSMKPAGTVSLKLSVSAAAAKVSVADQSLADTMDRCLVVLQSVKQKSKGIIVVAKDPASENTIFPIVANTDSTEELQQERFNHPWQ